MSGMPASIRLRFERYRSAPLTWQVGGENRRPAVCWVDERREVLCDADDGSAFDAVADRMMGGRYYPSDALDFFGDWMDEDRTLRAGDRILQRARLLPFCPWPVLWAMTEVFVAERTVSACTLGYATTERHFGRGIWQARLTRLDGRLELIVTSTSGPYSWLFWLGLPIARYLQLRAWRRAFEEFKTLGSQG
ncbi:MAG TPA: DUF1990 family protein [Fimbriimonadaceae bacterium]|nr:DUF1990 family protein [Fimbriimonadaceae bacterium]